MWTGSFWLDVAERAAKTFAQVLGAALVAVPAASAVGVDVLAVDWRTALSVAAGAAVLSVLSSVASAPLGERGTASLMGGRR